MKLGKRISIWQKLLLSVIVVGAMLATGLATSGWAT